MVYLGSLTTSDRSLNGTITGDDGVPSYPSARDAAHDIAAIWAATIGGYLATYVALTVIAACFT